LQRFSHDDEQQVRAVLRDLCESQLAFSSGAGSSISYRAASDEELASLKRKQASEGADELLLALMFREEPLTASETAHRLQAEVGEIEATFERLLQAGRIERCETDGASEPRYRANQLVVPIGAPVGWEAAVFDHFKALVTTVLSRLRENRTTALADQVGGSTYTIDVWEGHPLADEVYGALGRMRASLSELRARVLDFNTDRALPGVHDRVIIYVGQSLIHEGAEHAD
jgi:hypothetical protein